MKTAEKTTASKLVDRFDSQLRDLLMQDLKVMKAAKDKLINTIKGLDQDSLSAA